MKNLFSLTILLFSCNLIAMNDSEKRELLSNSARPIHDFLSSAVTTGEIPKGFIANFIATFEGLDVEPTLLTNLNDKRQNGTFTYNCPANERWVVKFDNTAHVDDARFVGFEQQQSIEGIPYTIDVTELGEGERVLPRMRTIHLANKHLFGKATYGLIELMFACNKVGVAQKILDASDWRVSRLFFSRTFPAFRAVHQRLQMDGDEDVRKNLNELEQEYNQVVQEDCCDGFCCAVQVVSLLVGGLSGGKEAKVGMAMVGTLRSIELTDFHKKYNPFASNLKKKKD